MTMHTVILSLAAAIAVNFMTGCSMGQTFTVGMDAGEIEAWGQAHAAMLTAENGKRK